jgi:aspartyl protease family protein
MQASDPSSSPPPDRNDSAASFGRGFAWVAWLFVLLLVYLFFDNTLDEQRNPNQQLQQEQGERGERVVILDANRQGHFVGTLQLNGQDVEFLLDTGATAVAVSEAVAARTGMQKGMTYQSSTANGVITVHRSRITELRLGSIVLRDLEASIVPNLAGAEILLGMSALNHLEFTKQQQQLRLIQR